AQEHGDGESDEVPYHAARGEVYSADTGARSGSGFGDVGVLAGGFGGVQGADRFPVSRGCCGPAPLPPRRRTVVAVRRRGAGLVPAEAGHYNFRSGLSGPKCFSITRGSLFVRLTMVTPSFATDSLTKYSSQVSWPKRIRAGVSSGSPLMVP